MNKEQNKRAQTQKGKPQKLSGSQWDSHPPPEGILNRLCILSDVVQGQGALVSVVLVNWFRQHYKRLARGTQLCLGGLLHQIPALCQVLHPPT